TRPMTLDLPPQGVEYNTRSIDVSAEISREERSVPFKSVRVEVVGAPKATTRPEVVQVTVSGLSETVAKISAEQLVPIVELPSDVDLSKPGSIMAKVLLEIPAATVTIEPEKVLVKW